ncbi:hypothetical protein MHYP_G00010120 [Metynnis hypsauchen]
MRLLQLPLCKRSTSRFDYQHSVHNSSPLIFSSFLLSFRACYFCMKVKVGKKHGETTAVSTDVQCTHSECYWHCVLQVIPCGCTHYPDCNKCGISSRLSPADLHPTLYDLWNSLVTLFLFCWLIAGSVWIYSIYPANYNKTRTGQPYCNKTLYLSAFWTTTLTPLAIRHRFTAFTEREDLRQIKMGFANVLIAGGSICSVRMSIILSLLPVVITGLGARHLYDCPKQPMVPVYLLVGGVACLCLQIFPIFYCRQSDGKISLICRIFNFLLLIFCPIWLITGSVFVYTAYQPNYKSRWSAEYCERILYEIAFWITTAIYVMIPPLLLYLCYTTCCENRVPKKCCISTVS